MRLAMRLDGPCVSVATLQGWCPTASRRAIVRWRRGEWQRRRQRSTVVQWPRAGRVWAMDFSHPPQPIDGQYRALLQVRDLASHYQLAALPVPRATASPVCGLLRALCATVAPPLVLKVDNGSAFASRPLRAWAAMVGTQLLYSPPRCPRYNGAIEASIGALTTRAHHAAVAAGHPEYWTCDDVERARTTGNAIAHASGRTPLERWRRAAAISGAERRRFRSQCATASARFDAAPPRVQQRLAIVDTLQRLGYVTMTRRADFVH